MPTMLEQGLAFVAEAERMTNERDVDGIRTVFAPDGRWTVTIDGTIVHANGIDEIYRGWAAMCDFMEARRMFVSKSLVSVNERTIVNEWTGEVARRPNARGIEIWQLNGDGRAVDQRLYGFLDARPDSSRLQSLRMLTAYPGNALAFARSQRA